MKSNNKKAVEVMFWMVLAVIGLMFVVGAMVKIVVKLLQTGDKPVVRGAEWAISLGERSANAFAEVEETVEPAKPKKRRTTQPKAKAEKKAERKTKVSGAR
jgi:hypothetical protein